MQDGEGSPLPLFRTGSSKWTDDMVAVDLMDAVKVSVMCAGGGEDDNIPC